MTQSIVTNVKEIKKFQKSHATRHCTKCGARRIAKSRRQFGDKLIRCFVPKRPYRCLHCYNRFWVHESYFANSGRTKTFAVLTVGLLLVTGLFFVPHNDVVYDELTAQEIQALFDSNGY